MLNGGTAATGPLRNGGDPHSGEEAPPPVQAGLTDSAMRSTACTVRPKSSSPFRYSGKRRSMSASFLIIATGSMIRFQTAAEGKGRVGAREYCSPLPSSSSHPRSSHCHVPPVLVQLSHQQGMQEETGEHRRKAGDAEGGDGAGGLGEQEEEGRE